MADASGAAQDVAGAEYARLLDALLADAASTKGSLESRAAGVITTSAALVTLLFGFAAVAAAKGAAQIPADASGSLAVALVLIVIASVLALIVTAPFVYGDVSTNGMERLTEETLWVYTDVVEASRMVAKVRVKALRWMRLMNTAKSIILVLAILAEVAGIGVLAATVVAMLPHK